MRMEDSGLIHACLFDGNGGAREVGWQEIKKWREEDGILWIHLSITSSEAKEWLYDESGIEPVIVGELVDEETRPRSTVFGKGVLLNLRGVNLNPGAAYEDMVSFRIWAEKNRVVTTRRRWLKSVFELKELLQRGAGPESVARFIIEINELITSRIEEAVEKLEDIVSNLEEQVMESHEGSLRSQISDVRRESIILRRYLAPQREAISRLQVDSINWLTERDKRQIHEIANTLIRVVEHLDSLRDRASIAQEELTNTLSAQLNSRMYFLSIITAIFLPLSFFTGLLGINVGGIPGADYKWAFLIVIFLLLLVSVGQYFYFRKKHWL